MSDTTASRIEPPRYSYRSAAVGVKRLVVRRIALLLAVAAGSVSCSSSTVAVPWPSPLASPTQQLGPGGLPLDAEIGAVRIVGFQGPVTDAGLSRWGPRGGGGAL